MNKNMSLKDVENFGTFLEALGRAIRNKPEAILAIINEDQFSNEHETKKQGKEVDVVRVNSFPLFDLAKSLDEENLISKLSEFSVEELRQMLKIYHLGGLKFRSKESIVLHIAEQAKKRTIDVFRDHDKQG